MKHKGAFLSLLFFFIFVVFHSCAPSDLRDILHSSLWELKQIASKEFPLVECEASIHQYIYFAQDGYVYELMMSEIKGVQVLIKKDVKTQYIILDDGSIKIGHSKFALDKNSTLNSLDEDILKITFEKTKTISAKDADNAEVVEVGLSIFQ